jgi:hypothetical protein
MRSEESIAKTWRMSLSVDGWVRFMGITRVHPSMRLMDVQTLTSHHKVC